MVATRERWETTPTIHRPPSHEQMLEFFGIPRQRAGRAELVVPAAAVGEALTAVERECPGLAGLVRSDGRLSPHGVPTPVHAGARARRLPAAPAPANTR